MDRYRLNLILQVLLFPVCDPEMGKKDLLIQKYIPYQNFMNSKSYGADGNHARDRSNEEFIKAEKKLLDYLAQINASRAKSIDDLKMLCDLYYPMKDIHCLIDQLDRKRKSEKGTSAAIEGYMSWYYMQKLVQIAKSLLTYNDGMVSIKTWIDDAKEDIFGFSSVFNKVEIWNLLCRMTTPDIYIAIYAVESGNDVRVLSGQKERISLTDKPLRERLCKGTAENHLHFHVGYDYELYWLYGTNLKMWRELQARKLDQRKMRLLQATVFRCFGALFLQSGEYDKKGMEFSEWLEERSRGRLKEYLYAMYTGSEISGSYGMQERQELAELYQIAGHEGSTSEYDCLLEGIYSQYMDLRTSSEFIFLFQACKYMKQNATDVCFTRFFIQYLRIKNKALMELQETYELKGLRYFQKKYHAARNALPDMIGRKEAVMEIFRSQSRIPSMKKMEIRIVPYVNKKAVVSGEYTQDRGTLLEGLCGQLYEIFEIYRRSILENLLGLYEAREYLKLEEQAKLTMDKRRLAEYRIHIRKEIESNHFCVPTMGIIFHFIKSNHLSNQAGYICWRNIWKGIRLQTDYSMVSRQHMKNTVLALQEIRSKIPYISEYIVGIDAASDENAMEPWMFAPAYRTLNADNNIKVQDAGVKIQNVQSIRFTYHVGEDFRHILSGLRHIDEVLKEFHYQVGDRLGHALAMGIDPKRWVVENEVVSMPKQEWMEDLLWVWGKKIFDEVELPVSTEVLEHKIISIAEQIYANPESLSVRMLYQAYKKKFEDLPLSDEQGMAVSSSSDNVKRKTFCYYEDVEEKDCYEGWGVEKLCLTNYCPVLAEKYNEIIHVSVQEEEAELYRLLQEHLIEKVERMGIYIETNPTSNLTIGDFARMKEHPIFRWNAIREGSGHHAFVMINSDDPAVFHTNVENELAYIYYAAEYQGYSKEEVLNWVDKIRQNGIDGSFVAREKGAIEILDEVEQIMERLQDKNSIWRE